MSCIICIQCIHIIQDMQCTEEIKLIVFADTKEIILEFYEYGSLRDFLTRKPKEITALAVIGEKTF